MDEIEPCQTFPTIYESVILHRFIKIGAILCKNMDILDPYQFLLEYLKRRNFEKHQETFFSPFLLVPKISSNVFNFYVSSIWT